MDEIARLLELQDGVIARHQAIAAGMTEVAVARMVRRREWVPVHRGVYVDHTGPVSRRQQAWAAVLACWPAALDGWSAVRAHEGPGRRRPDRGAIEVMVAHGRHPIAPAGVVVRQSRRFDDQVQWNLAPPRMRYDDTIIDLADRASRDVEAIAVLAEACGGRRTTAARLRMRLEEIPRLHRRTFLLALLADVEAGTCSVLEHRYLTDVERPHGLPRADRQLVVTGPNRRRMMRDVVYRGARPTWTQIVELDGRLFHDTTAARDRDLERDLDAALVREHSVRLGYGQVTDRPCRTALKIYRLLRLRGRRARFTCCPSCPTDVIAEVERIA